MDEVQSWWEVPAIAHFCYAFRDVFNLLYFEIGELEAALLKVQDPELSISLEQLVIKLLQGCFGEKDVRADNWEEKLIEVFEENCDDDDDNNPVKNRSFHFLSPRQKVECLYKLCQFLLDTEGTLDIIKDIPAENMKADCVGKDSQNNLYWYFCDERLYKEDPSVKAKKTDQPIKSETNKNAKTNNGKRSTTRQRKPVVSPEISSPWTIVCHNTSDWETLVKGFSKTKNANEKVLVKEVTTKYLPLLKEVVAEKDQLLRKRYLEFAPKRVSSRISKVKAQRKMEDQKAAEAAEEKRKQQEEEQKKKEAEHEKMKKEARQRRVEEREKIIHGRLIRAKQREMMRGRSPDSESEKDEKPSESRPQRACRSRSQSTEQNTNNVDVGKQSDKESFVYNNMSKRTSPRNSITCVDKNTDEKDHDYHNTSRSSSSKSSPSFASDRPEPRLAGPSEDIGSYSLNRTVDSSKRKVATISYLTFPDTKHLKNGANYTVQAVKAIPSAPSISCFKENNWYTNNCKKVTNSPAIIRLSFVKPPAKSQS
ncbi:hypothetical protein JTE90_019539 [Oedothorax gibbosus]|uniref:Cat eye syndrome critical region protein 2 n=1 Tax=Oedothorax gibbosus TaxID=931172 RepID=A0AAV6U8X7_9ARAC|nr:hypothetical protein JTE90_019539 [Oedothorax gibbosus]